MFFSSPSADMLCLGWGPACTQSSVPLLTPLTRNWPYLGLPSSLQWVKGIHSVGRKKLSAAGQSMLSRWIQKHIPYPGHSSIHFSSVPIKMRGNEGNQTSEFISEFGTPLFSTACLTWRGNWVPFLSYLNICTKLCEPFWIMEYSMWTSAASNSWIFCSRYFLAILL